MSTTAYRGSRVVFATMHGKEELARDAFADILGAVVVATPNLDTDQFGTFSADIPRTLSPRSAARVKARLGMQLADTPYGLASEGSFSAGFGNLVEHQEILMFIDSYRGLELVEGTVSTSTLTGGRPIASAQDGLRFAEAVGFPAQGILLTGGASGEVIHKIQSSVESLADLLTQLLLTSSGPVVIAPDYRAHRCPSRSQVIATLARSMAMRLSTPCPDCQTPGFGQIDVERGLRCADCGEPTRVIAADMFGCGSCSHGERRARQSRRAAAAWCDFCNP